MNKAPVRFKRAFALGLIVVFAGSLAAACAGLSVPAGIAGGVLALLATAFLLSGTVGTQSGCSKFSACLSMIPPQDAGASRDANPQDASLGEDARAQDAAASDDVRVGPCLGMQQTDSGPDAEIGPCLSRLMDGGVGPCLSDTGPSPCLSGDAGATDARVGPCLSPPRPDTGIGDGQAARPSRGDRRATIARLAAQGVLPPDVAARLLKNGAPGEES